jgi:lysyl-tRNA synthetase class 2
MKDINPQKIRQDIGEINKKYKLELALPSVEVVAEWVSKI